MSEEEIRKEILGKVADYYSIKFRTREFVPGKTKINYAGRVFDEKELINLVDASLDFWLTAGRYSQHFTEKLEDFFKCSNVILTNSGSSANLLAISALTSEKLGPRRLVPGDEVITVAGGFPSTVAPLVQNQLIPVFLDLDPVTYNIDTTLLKKAVSPRTKAVMLAHTLGNPFNLAAVMEVVKDNNLWLIEDNCDALGSLYDGKLTGTFGDIATVSFYPAHHITTGEGGCVLTDNELLARIIRSFRDWGRDCYCEGGENNTCGKRFTQKFGSLPEGYDHKYVYSEMGYNLKMTDMQAAIGVAQMDKLSSFIQNRKDNFKYLYRGLSHLDKYLQLPVATEKSDPAWFGFIVTLKDSKNYSRQQLLTFLEGNMIETRNLFAGNLLRQPGFKNIKHRVAGNLDTTDHVMNNSFFLGTYPGLTRDKLDFIIDKVGSFLKGTD